MTNRVNGLFISLDKDYRDDDVEIIVNAIRMIKGVSGVKVNVVDSDDYFNRDRIKYQIKNEIIKSINDIFE